MDEDIDYKKTDLAKPITKGELEQDISEKDEIKKISENIGEGGKRF